MNVMIVILVVVVAMAVLVGKFRLHSAVVSEAGKLGPEHNALWQENKRPPIRNLAIFIVLLGGVFLLSLNSSSNAEALMALPVIAWLAATFSWIDRRRLTQALKTHEFPAVFLEAVSRLKAFEWGVLALLALIWTGFGVASISGSA